MFNLVYKDIDFSHKLDRASSPKDEYWKHMHPFNEILYFLSGHVTYSVEGKTQVLSPHTLVFIRPGKFHFATVDKGLNYERFVLKFPDSILPEYIAKRLDEIPVYTLHFIDDDHFFDRLDYFADKEDFTDEEKRTLFVTDTIRFLLFLSKRQDKVITEKETIAGKITFYIEHHLEENLTLDDIAKNLNYSKSYLASVFREQIHVPIMQYLRSKKCILAYQRIQNGEKPHKVAEDLGFGDYSTFYRAYKSVLGFAPSEKDKDLRLE